MHFFSLLSCEVGLDWRRHHFVPFSFVLKCVCVCVCSKPKKTSERRKYPFHPIHFGIWSFIRRLLLSLILFAVAHRNLFLYWFATEKRFNFCFEFVLAVSLYVGWHPKSRSAYETPYVCAYFV